MLVGVVFANLPSAWMCRTPPVPRCATSHSGANHIIARHARLDLCNAHHKQRRTLLVLLPSPHVLGNLSMSILRVPMPLITIPHLATYSAHSLTLGSSWTRLLVSSTPSPASTPRVPSCYNTFNTIKLPLAFLSDQYSLIWHISVTPCSHGAINTTSNWKHVPNTPTLKTPLLSLASKPSRHCLVPTMRRLARLRHASNLTHTNVLLNNTTVRPPRPVLPPSPFGRLPLGNALLCNCTHGVAEPLATLARTPLPQTPPCAARLVFSWALTPSPVRT